MPIKKPKWQTNREEFLAFLFSTHYTLKAQDACGTYIIKKYGKKVANMGIAGGQVFINFNNK